MTREEANFYLANMDRKYMEKGMSEALDMAISALDNKTPCSLCRFRNEDTGICDMCPAMPLERGAE